MDQCWQNQAREGGRRERNREGYGGGGKSGGGESILKLRGIGRQRNNRIQRMTIEN